MLHDIAPPASGLRFSARTEGGYTIAALSGELDVACTPVLREQLLSVLRPRASRLVVDLSEVSFCDASGLAVLIGTGRRARLLGGVLRLAAPAHAVTAALRLSGLLRQFDIFPTVLAATAQPQPAKHIPDTSTQMNTSSQAASGGARPPPALQPPADGPGPRPPPARAPPPRRAGPAPPAPPPLPRRAGAHSRVTTTPPAAGSGRLAGGTARPKSGPTLTQTFGYVQPDRDDELIELSKEPSWSGVAYSPE